ncbi:two-component regulator propeller domain-containing protein [Pseudoxanthomonas sp.]|uniref:two-component regulator propeller domain-containing protein n=1 Tax=Pseudoxanthomonas sp. TaxID=1871049 RepID=UPI00260382F9|nr:two-component regulator propeller domain-containing protein [Pseudoxanthomonas sp.]WDS37650.1 MAG: two-component regulator propeller domain-containing protein [Pseudoxanthomonas sp.]
MWARRFFLCGLLAWAGLAQAAVPLTPQPRQMGVGDGLPSGRVNAFAEDKLGYLWMATHDGLARYDGRGFRIWRMEDGLRDNLIWSLHSDLDNRLWIGTENAGIAVLDADRRMFHFYNRQNTPELTSNTIWCIEATADGSLWFGTQGGGLTRRLADGSFQHFMPVPGDPRSLPSNEIVHMAVTSDGSLWLATRAGVARWTGRDFERVPDDALPSPLVNRLRPESDGSLWIATTRGAVLRKPDGQYVKQPWGQSSNIPVLQTLLRDHAGTYWLDTASGLGYQAGGAVHNVPLYSVSAKGMVKPSWATAYEDRDGGLWFASINAGLWHLPANWRQFAVLTNDDSDPASMYNPYVLVSTPATGGGLWLAGTRSALDWLDPVTGKVQHHLRVIDSVQWPQAMAEDRAGRVWIGLADTLQRYDPASHQVRRWVSGAARDAMLAGSTDLIRACGDQLWLYSRASGMQLRDLDGHVLAAPRLNLAKNSFVQDARCGPDGRLWLASDRGVRAWDPASQQFQAIAGDVPSAAFSLAFPDAQHLWVGRMGRIERYGWNGQRLELLAAIGEEKGFPAAAPTGLVVDDQGVVWTSSSRGLARTDPVTGSVRQYGVRDGLPNPDIRELSLVQATTGQISAATPDGLVLFDPGQLVPSKRQPSLQIEFVGVRRGDDGLDLTHVAEPQVDSNDRDLHIVARLLSFSGSDDNSYRFRLNGYDPGWVDVGTTGERLFSRLPPGRYTLEIQGRSSDSVWSSVKTLRFRVLPPWWRSPWGLVCWIGLSLLLIFWGLYLYRLRLRRRTAWQMAQHERTVAEQASRAKTHFLATLGHEVRTPMTGVLGMSELLLSTNLDERQHGYTRSIQNAGTHLLRLVNDALDLARIEAGRLELDQQDFDLRELLDGVVALTAPMAGKRGLAFSSDVAAGLPVALRGDPVRVRQILLNLLNNAVKFTEQGWVRLQALPLEGGGVRLIVSDSGPGIAAGQVARLFQRFEQAEGARTAARYGGSGLGLAISQELAGAMGGRISVESMPGQGTRFLVDLPLPTAARGTPTVVVPARDESLPLSVLLVEDDATIAEVITGLLRARGHRVQAVGHGLAALTEVAVGGFDIALLDLDLPGMDGLSLARQLRAQGFQAALLAVTARADGEAEAQTRAAGFDGFLRKPVTGEMLVEAIGMARAVAQRRIEQ